MSRRFQLVIQPEAKEGIENAFQWIAEHSPEGAAKWRQGLYEAIRSLAALPHRCALAPESSYFPEEIRQLLYGKRGSVYRILFTIENDTVHVLYIRHSAQRWAVPENG